MVAEETIRKQIIMAGAASLLQDVANRINNPCPGCTMLESLSIIEADGEYLRKVAVVAKQMYAEEQDREGRCME